MRDINPDPYGPSERSIRNISVSPRRAATQHEEPRAPRPRRKKRGGRMLLWLVTVVVLCAVVSIGVSTVFSGSTVHIYARTAVVQPTGTLTAQLAGATGVLTYTPITVTRSATTTVPATGTKQVSRQASGVVTIYNTYSSANQRLIANTRLQAPDGKIYRIQGTVTVPGMQGSTPGSVTATVYADSPGDSYNRSGDTTFTIPGFQGDPRYAKFSAKSQGAISGGFVGTEPAVAPGDLAAAKATLEKQLATDINAAAVAAIPDGDVALPGSLSISYGSLAQTTGSGNTAIISEAATAKGAVMSIADLSSAIASKTVSDYKGEAVTLDQSSQLNLTATTTSQEGLLQLTLGGSATLVWQFDSAAVKQALLGKPKSQFQDVVKSFAPAITCTQTNPCDASIRPFWQSNFPADPAKITIITGQAK